MVKDGVILGVADTITWFEWIVLSTWTFNSAYEIREASTSVLIECFERITLVLT